MKRLALALTFMATGAFADPPVPANEGYCVGIDPANCPYSYAQDGDHWYFEGVPIGRDVHCPWRLEGPAGARKFGRANPVPDTARAN